MEEIEALRLRAKRERLARVEAERLLEIHSHKLLHANRQLQRQAVTLSEEFGKKSTELLYAQQIGGFGTMVWALDVEEINWSNGFYAVTEPIIWSDGTYVILALDPGDSTTQL